MAKQSGDELDKIFNQYFAYLTEDYGFSIIKKEYFPEIFGNFIVRLKKDDVQMIVSKDRDQVFVDFSMPKTKEKDKEYILEEMGVSRKRYPTKSGLWTGYEIENQSVDLKKHLKMILDQIQSQQGFE
jgi:hypothetical protein